MKRLISLFLIFVLALSLLCGCGKGNEVIVGGDADDQQSGSKLSDDKLSEALKSVEWTKGTVTDGVYRNEALNLTFQMPEDWMQATEDEMKDIFGIDPNAEDTFYDACLYAERQRSVVTLAGMNLRKYLGGMSMTDEKLLAEIVEESETSHYSEQEVITLCGREWRSMVNTDYDTDGSVDTVSRILISRLGKDKLAMLMVVTDSQKELDYTMAHFTDDPSTIPAPPEPAARLTRGVYNGNSYANELLGLRFDLPEGWAFASDRDLAELIGLVPSQELAELIGPDPDAIDEEVFNDPAAVKELFESQSSFYDMVASDPGPSMMVQLAMEDPAASGSGDLTVEDYAGTVVDQLRDSGWRYEIGEPEQCQVAGIPFTMVPAVMESRVYQYIYIARVEGIMLIITFSGMDTGIQDYIDCFSQF